MARGPRLSSPAVQSAPWSYESTSNNAQMMPMPDILLKFISGSYLPRRATCSTKQQRIVSNLRVLFLQTLPANIYMGCSTSRPRRMKTSTSSSRASLVSHLELLRKEPAYDQCLARSGTSDRAKHIGTLLCGDAQEKDYIVFGPKPRTDLARSKSTWVRRGTSIVVATTSRAPWMRFSEPKQSPDR